jgi:hypothetical protein
MGANCYGESLKKFRVKSQSLAIHRFGETSTDTRNNLI